MVIFHLTYSGPLHRICIEIGVKDFVVDVNSPRVICQHFVDFIVLCFYVLCPGYENSPNINKYLLFCKCW